MKYLVLPAMMLALAASAHAGISANFSVNSAEHWVIRGQQVDFDGKALTPFGGTLRSSLTPQFTCRSSYSGSAHNSHCWFDLDTSRFHSPYDQEFERRTGGADPRFGGLVSRLQVNADGSYQGYFNFTTSNFGETADATGIYHNTFSSSYIFRYQGTGLAWDTGMNAALAGALWQKESLFDLTFNSSWDHSKFDPLTGEESTIEAEGWDGKMDVSAVPEPAAPALFGIGLVAIAGLRRKRRA